MKWNARNVDSMKKTREIITCAGTVNWAKAIDSQGMGRSARVIEEDFVHMIGQRPRKRAV